MLIFLIAGRFALRVAKRLKENPFQAPDMPSLPVSKVGEDASWKGEREENESEKEKEQDNKVKESIN